MTGGPEGEDMHLLSVIWMVLQPVPSALQYVMGMTAWLAGDRGGRTEASAKGAAINAVMRVKECMLRWAEGFVGVVGAPGCVV